MGRRSATLPDTDEGHEDRLRRVQDRTQSVLSCSVAQDPKAPRLGTTFTAWIDRRRGTAQLEVPGVDREALAYAAVLARPFTLAREAIFGPHVSASLLRFSTTEPQRVMSEQVATLWGRLPALRMQLFASRMGRSDHGAWDAEVADRILYSQVVHADDARDVLEHVPGPIQLMAFAGYVGDWLAVIAHQQHVLKMVRPDICPELTSWAGDARTIFDRLGATAIDR